MKEKFRLEGLDCADCASKIETAICKLDGVKDASVNFFTQRLIIEAEDDKMNSIIKASKKIIRKVEPDTRLVKG